MNSLGIEVAPRSLAETVGDLEALKGAQLSSQTARDIAATIDRSWAERMPKVIAQLSLSTVVDVAAEARSIYVELGGKIADAEIEAVRDVLKALLMEPTLSEDAQNLLNYRVPQALRYRTANNHVGALHVVNEIRKIIETTRARSATPAGLQLVS